MDSQGNSIFNEKRDKRFKLYFQKCDPTLKATKQNNFKKSQNSRSKRIKKNKRIKKQHYQKYFQKYSTSV